MSVRSKWLVRRASWADALAETQKGTHAAVGYVSRFPSKTQNNSIGEKRLGFTALPCLLSEGACGKLSSVEAHGLCLAPFRSEVAVTIAPKTGPSKYN